MEKTVKRSLAIKAVVAIMLAVIVAVALTGTVSTYAEEVISSATAERSATKIAVGIDVQNSRVIATVKNVFTFGSATIPTYVELYTSTELYSDFHDMTLVARKYDSDLDIFEEMSVDATGRGELKFWVAVARYKINDSNWTELYTRYIIVDADGNYIATV